jgi:hypothetical protein
MSAHEGSCLRCGIRHAAASQPLRVTICHCRFCQRATGAAHLGEPILGKSDFGMMSDQPKVYRHRSEGSGKMVDVHFCDTCGTKLFLSFELPRCRWRLCRHFRRSELVRTFREELPVYLFERGPTRHRHSRRHRMLRSACNDQPRKTDRADGIRRPPRDSLRLTGPAHYFFVMQSMTNFERSSILTF